MECRGFCACSFVLFLFSTAAAHYLRDPKNETISSQDYGTQNPGQQLSKDPHCDCEWRYLKHYEAKGCRPVYEEKPQTDKPSCTCPWRFDCSQADDIHEDDKVCLYKKHVYPVGSKIPTSNPCETCSCATDYFTQAASISCTTTECPAVYSQTPLPEGCHYVYKEDQCCPTSVECPTAQKDNMYQVPACEYKGKMYYEGEQIYPDEDPCLICLCNQNWTGINSSSCRQHDCMLERDARKLKQGCIPIYHEKTCCPIDYHCADDDFDFKSNRGASFKSDDDEDEMCFFESRYYPIGHVLDIKHPTNCVTCTCKTPPDFTCIHSSCPPPPNNDYTNCRAVYKPHSCCPDYTCEEKTIDFENTKKEEELNEEKQKDSLQQLIQECKKTQCSSDERCMLVQQKCDKEPCLPVPKCEKVSFGCGQTSCAEGCVEIGSYENNCPLCYCKEQIKELQYKLTCRVQSCEENCVFTGRDEDGCPICKCPQGNLEERACASSPCRGFNCSMTVNSLGCAECRCQLSCKPKECPVGCDLDLDVPENNGLECGCHCKNSTTAVEYIHSKPIPETCSNISCRGLNCTVGEDRSGCPFCNCKAPCPTPVCQEGCQVERETSEPGRCPGCVCKLSRSIRDNKAKECPPPMCLGYNCSVITGENGCQICLCESPCEEAPQCPSHCKLETNVPEGRCRGCVCSFGEQAGSDNKPQRGGGKVPDGEENDVEPEKREDLEADFIPLPGKELVPGVDKIFLIHGDVDQDQYAGVPGYHYDGGHAYPVFGEPLESGFYNVDDHIPGEFESSLVDEAREEVDDETSANRNEDTDVDYGHEEESFIPEYAEEKAMEDSDDDKCAQKKCPEGQKCVIRRLQCIRTPCPTIPVCIDVEPRCPIPMCAIGCMVMKWDDEVCPSCFCGIIRGAEGRVCPRTRCMGRRCYNVIGDDGCPQCKCDSICIPPKCYDGCYIEKDPPAGKCPTCTCPDRGSVVQPIIPGTSPAENATGSNVELGSENLEESTEGSEDNDKILPANEETEDIQGRNPIVPADDPPSAAQERPDSVDRNKLLDEDIAADFYNSLAEIEEQVKSGELTTVTVNLPTTIDAADVFDTSTVLSEDINSASDANHFVTNDETVEVTTMQSSKTVSTTDPIPTTVSLNYAAEEASLPSKPCMQKPNITDEDEDTESLQNSGSSSEVSENLSFSDNEQVTVSSTEVNTPSTPSTRKPQRRPAISKPISNTSNKNTVNRFRPQNENPNIKPKPQVTSTLQSQHISNVNTDSKRPLQSSVSSSSYESKPVSKPQIFDSYLDETEHEDDMKPILQNLQQLMSNLHHVLSSHQRPTNIEEAFQNLQSSLNSPSILQENSTPTVDKNLNENSASEVDTNKQSETISSETTSVAQNLGQSESHKGFEVNSLKDHIPEKKPTEQHSQIGQNLASEENNAPQETQSVSNPQNDMNYQSGAMQQQYFVNPNILPPQQQVVPSILQQGMQTQFHMFPQFPYQPAQSNLQAMGIMHPQIPYQSHVQSLYAGGQNPIFNGQPQSPYYPSIQHPSFITNVNPFQSEQYGQSSSQANKQQLLLTNIPIPPSLQQQLNAGTQTLGFLQHLINQNNPYYQQQFLQLQQHQQMNFPSPDPNILENQGGIQESIPSQTIAPLNEQETVDKQQMQSTQQQNAFVNVPPLSAQQQFENAEAASHSSSTANEHVIPSFTQIHQQGVPTAAIDQLQAQQEYMVGSVQGNIPVQQQEKNSSLTQLPLNSQNNYVSSNHRPSTQTIEQPNENMTSDLQPMPAFPSILDDSANLQVNTDNRSSLNSSEDIQHRQTLPLLLQAETTLQQFNHHVPQAPLIHHQLPTASNFQANASQQQQQQQVLPFNALSQQQQQQQLENLAQQYQQLQEQFNQIQTQQQYVPSQINSSKPLDILTENDQQVQHIQHSIPQVSSSNSPLFSNQQQSAQDIFHQAINTASQEQKITLTGTENILHLHNAGQSNGIPSSLNPASHQGVLQSNQQLLFTDGKDNLPQINIQEPYISNHNVPLEGQQQQLHQTFEYQTGHLTPSQQGQIQIHQDNSQHVTLSYQQQQAQEQSHYVNLQEVPLNQQQTENQPNQFVHVPQMVTSLTEQGTQQHSQQQYYNKLDTTMKPQQTLHQQQQINNVLNNQLVISDEKQNVLTSNTFPSEQANSGQISGPNSFVAHQQHIYNPSNTYNQVPLNNQQNNAQFVYNQEGPSVQTDPASSTPLSSLNTHVNQQQVQNQYAPMHQELNKQFEGPGLSSIPQAAYQQPAIQQNTYIQYKPVEQQHSFQQYGVHSVQQHQIQQQPGMSQYQPTAQQLQNNSVQNSPFIQQQNSNLISQFANPSHPFTNTEEKLENIQKLQAETMTTNLTSDGPTAFSQQFQQPHVNTNNLLWTYPQQQSNQQATFISSEIPMAQTQHQLNTAESKPHPQSQAEQLQSYQHHQQQFLHQQQTVPQQQFNPSDKPLHGAFQSQQQQYLAQNQHQQFASNEKPLPETYQGQQFQYQQQHVSNDKPLTDPYHSPQQQAQQQHFSSNQTPLPESYQSQQQYMPQQFQQQFNVNNKPLPGTYPAQLQQQPQIHQQLSNQQQQYIHQQQNIQPQQHYLQQQQSLLQQQQGIQQLIQPQQNFQQQQNSQEQYLSANEKPLSEAQHQFFSSQDAPHVHQVHQVQQHNYKPSPAQQIQHQQQLIVTSDAPLILAQQFQQQITSNQPQLTQVQPIHQNQNFQQHSFNFNANVPTQTHQQTQAPQETSSNIFPSDQDKKNQLENLNVHANGPLIQSNQTPADQDQILTDLEFSDENEDHIQINSSDSDEETSDNIEQEQESFMNADSTPSPQIQEIQQQNVGDKYSALKPLAQITTAELQSNEQVHLQNDDSISILGPNEAAPIQQVLEDLKPKYNETIESSTPDITQQSVPPFQQVHVSGSYNLKTRPGAVVRPHFSAISPKPSSSSPSNHDLFPAPSRPINNKPTIQQQDWVDEEFEEEDSSQEMEALDYEDFELPEATTISTSEPFVPYREPIAPSNQEQLPVQFPLPTPSQHDILENFDNHQPGHINKPINQQQIIDEYKATTPQKFFYVRTSTTPRPSSKFPFTSNIFASFPTVSPTAEAYGAQKYSSKPPLSPIPSYQCPTPHCNGYNCSLIRGSDGCQKCVCDSPCAPCPQHCVKTKTLSEGRCPICDCTAAPSLSLATPVRHCPPVDCSGSNCRKVRDNDGCMTCICDPKCVEPQCDPGCEILRDVPPGQCPGCVCRVTVVQAVVQRPRQCSPVTCSKHCKETRGPDGCPLCVCHPDCPPMKCDPGCQVQTGVAAGQCPTCVCSNFADDDDDDDDDLYCPNLFCSEYGCREIPGPAGCPICMCDPVCKTPVCEPGCQVVSDKYHGRCPVCLCSNPINGSSAAAPVFTQVEEGVKTVPVVPQQVQSPVDPQQVQSSVAFNGVGSQQVQSPVTFTGLVEPVVAEEEEESTASTLHTTVTVELETEDYTEETTTTETTTATCPAAVCSGLRCSMEMRDDGCEVCKCKYKCPTPKCVGNCYAETNAPSHRCPGCVCPQKPKPPRN